MFSFRAKAQASRKGLLLLGTSCTAAVVLLHLRFCLTLTVGSSMWPTLISGDLLLVDKFAYRAQSPRRGDIVVGKCGREFLVKRVVGLPGEQVEIVAGLLYINGTLVAESHPLKTRPDFNIRSGQLLPGRFATLGDNRDIEPRRAVHPIFSQAQLLGKVVWSVRLWPFVSTTEDS